MSTFFFVDRKWGTQIGNLLTRKKLPIEGYISGYRPVPGGTHTEPNKECVVGY